MSGHFIKRTVISTTSGLCFLYAAKILWNKKGEKVIAAGPSAEEESSSAHHPRSDPIDSDDDSVSDLRLKHVQIIMRHGIRMPLHQLELDDATYDKRVLTIKPGHTDIPFEVFSLDGGPRPVSPLEKKYEERKFKGGMHAGILTAQGRDQAYLLGRRLRKRYIEHHKFIGTLFDPAEVHLQSTNINRSIDTLQCVVAGFYGPEALQKYGPVAIKVTDTKKEFLYPNFGCCENLSKLSKKAWDHEADIPGLVEDRAAMLKDVGLPENTKVFFMGWRDNIIARKAMGVEASPKLEKWLPMIERYAVATFVRDMCGLPEYWHLQIPLAVGQVFGLLLENVDNIIGNKPAAHKMQLYSAHDSTIMPLCVALGVFDNKWVPFTGDVTFELYEHANGNHWMKVLYCGKEVIPKGCDKPLIPLSKLREILAPNVITAKQYESLCTDKALFDRAMKALHDEKKSESKAHV